MIARTSRTSRTLAYLANRRFLLLDRKLTARQARELLWRLRPLHAVIPLDDSGQRFTIHGCDLLRLLLSRGGAETPLAQALELETEEPVPILSPYQPAWNVPDLCLLVDDGRIVGVLDVDQPGDGPLRSGHGADLRSRFLAAEHEAEVVLGELTPVVVSLEPEPLLSAVQKRLALPVGSVVDVWLRARRGVAVEGPQRARLTVHEDEEASLPFQFWARATEVGRGRLEVLSFHRGAPLARLVVEPLVQQAGRAAGPSLRTSRASTLHAEARLEPPPASRADLSLSIFEMPTDRGLALHFELTGRDDSRTFPDLPPREIAGDPHNHLWRIFQEMEEGGRAGSSQITGEILTRRGARLYRDLFPEELQQLVWSLRSEIRSVQIYSDELWIPWELCRLTGRDNGGRIAEDGFFCERFAIGRWHSKGTPPPIAAGPTALVVPADSGLDQAARERDDLLQLSRGRMVTVEASYSEVIEALTAGTFAGFHFSGHGRGVRDGGDGCYIELEDQRVLQPSDLSGVVENLGCSSPFIFLNACQAGLAAPGLAGIEGWPKRFLDAGAGAFLGTYWPVSDKAARSFARHVYEKLFAGETIGEAVRHARCRVRDDFPHSATWLAYTLYADPLAKLGSAEAQAERPAA